MVNDTNHVLEGLGGSAHILDVLLELDIDDVVAVVGDRGLVALDLVVGAITSAKACRASGKLRERLDGAESVQVAKRSDLDGESKGGSEALAQLGVVDDADELLGHDLNHLLTEQSTATTLDKRQVGIHSISTIDGNIELALLVQGNEGNLHHSNTNLSESRET